MPQDVTFTDASRKFQSISGLETLTSADTFFLEGSFSRSALNAYHESNFWPRFLTVGEERTVTNETIPYVENGKNTISEFIRIYDGEPYSKLPSYEYEFYVDGNGANIINTYDDVTTAYVTYKVLYNPSFTRDSTDIPQEFLDYMLFTALGDFYTGDGQTENAAVAYNRASNSLNSELFRLEQKNNSNIMGLRFLTHHNKQAR